MLNINIKNLQNEVELREQRKYTTFDKVLESCYAKILSANQKSNDCCCLFTCPPVIFGVPLYNVTDCVKYVMEKLALKHFKLYFTHPNSIFISWKNEISDVKSTDTDKAADYYKKRKEQGKLLDKFQQKQLLYEPQDLHTYSKPVASRPLSNYPSSNQPPPSYSLSDTLIPRDQYLFKNSLANNDLLQPRNNHGSRSGNTSTGYDTHTSHMNNSNYNSRGNQGSQGSQGSQSNSKKIDKKPKDFRPISDYRENKIFDHKNININNQNHMYNINDISDIGDIGDLGNLGDIEDINLDLFD